MKEKDSGFTPKRRFTGVRGSVAFNVRLWFSVFGYLCVNLQQESPLLLDFCSVVTVAQIFRIIAFLEGQRRVLGKPCCPYLV